MIAGSAPLCHSMQAGSPRKLPEFANKPPTLKSLIYLLGSKRSIVIVLSATPKCHYEAEALLKAYSGTLQLRVLLFPLFDVFFRTEERHLVSSMYPVFWPFGIGHTEMKKNSFRLLR